MLDIRRVRAPGAPRQALQQPLSFFGVSLKIPEDVLNQDHRGIDNNSEIDCADGKQVRAFSHDHQEDGGEEQGERNVQPDDDRAAEVAEEDPLDQKNQQTSEDQVVQNGMGGDGNQGRAVVERNNPDSPRQTAIVIQRVDRLLDLGNHVGGFFRPSLHYDCPDDIVLAVAAQNTEPWPVAYRDLPDILHQNRNTVLLAENDILDVVYLVAFASDHRCRHRQSGRRHEY